MAEPYVGEIRMFGGNFEPRQWAMCNGQLLSISDYDVLFSLIGTIYGGDGVTSFALPDMRGRVPIHQGSSAGLTSRAMGQSFGHEYVTLTSDHVPTHTHVMMANSTEADQLTLTNHVLAGTPADDAFYDVPEDPTKIVSLKPECVHQAGGGSPHYNFMPYQCVNFIIALDGIYPSRN